MDRQAEMTETDRNVDGGTLSYLCVGIRIAERRLLNNRYEGDDGGPPRAVRQLQSQLLLIIIILF